MGREASYSSSNGAASRIEVTPRNLVLGLMLEMSKRAWAQYARVLGLQIQTMSCCILLEVSFDLSLK